MKRSLSIVSSLLSVSLMLCAPVLAAPRIPVSVPTPSTRPVIQIPSTLLLSTTWPGDATSPSDFFTRLLTFRPAKHPSGTAAQGSAQASRQDGAGGPLVCSVQKFKIADSPPQYAAGTFDQDKLWVGALLQSKGLADGLGSLAPLAVPAAKRLPIQLTSQLPIPSGSETVAPTQSGYNAALARIRQAATGTPLGSTVRYEFAEESGFESSALQLGLNASYLTAKASASLKLQSQSSSHKLTAVFYQNVFTVNADLAGQTPAAALFGSLSVADLTALGNAGQLSYSNPPAYVDSVTYGRLLLVSMESNFSSSEMQAALRASYNFVAGSVSGSLDANQKKVLSSSKFSVYASGGDEGQVIDLIRTGSLGSYFKGVTSPTTFVPISFTARNLGDNSYAATFRTGEYSVTTCNAASLTLKVQVLFHSVQTNDNKYDDVYGSVRFDGQQLWQRGSGDHFDVFKGNTARLYPDASEQFNKTRDYSLVVNYDTGQTASLDVTLMDYDSASPDDRLGTIRPDIDVDEVARTFRDHPGTSVVRRTYAIHGDDGASGEVIVEFRK
ncbi:thiol-activated cytolysin family protein [Deinococcus ruber]|uniref:thiol-activated cytolysin family protein n=1 Tax=Deinococcus ruber TaxID=1848197 RepID=UPI0016652C38|nr:thiol-activated cytolysin family protein [Deinococcus ruber]